MVKYSMGFAKNGETWAESSLRSWVGICQGFYITSTLTPSIQHPKTEGNLSGGRDPKFVLIIIHSLPISLEFMQKMNVSQMC